MGWFPGRRGSDWRSYRFSHANEAINCHTDVTVDGREGIGGLFGMCYYTWIPLGEPDRAGQVELVVERHAGDLRAFPVAFREQFGALASRDTCAMRAG